MFDLKTAVRKPQTLTALETIAAHELVSHLGADKLSMVANAEGREFIHVTNTKTGDYFSIKVGNKAEVSGSGEDRLRGAINNNLIYCGVSDNGAWFTLGRKGQSNEPIATISAADFFKNVAADATK